FLGVVREAAPGGRVPGERNRPFRGTGDHMQPVAAGRQRVPLDADGVAELDGRVVVGPGAPHAAVGDDVAEDRASAHERPVIDDGDVGQADALRQHRSLADARQVEQHGLVAVLELRARGRGGQQENGDTDGGQQGTHGSIQRLDAGRAQPPVRARRYGQLVTSRGAAAAPIPYDPGVTRPQWEFGLTLDKHGDRPLFLQIAHAIADDICRGRLAAGDPLPGSVTLARSLGVNRVTVLTAYEELAAEGWIVSQRARGAWVSAEIPESRSGRPVRVRA